MTRIGIIEDDRLLNEALCTYLETLGYITDSAFSFEEGMALADKHPDLLLADIGLDSCHISYRKGRRGGYAQGFRLRRR